MRVLCVGRHAYLSEHLCRYFGALGAECESVVGTGDVPAAALRFEPHAVMSDIDLLTGPLLDAWSNIAVLSGTPILAVSLTRRPEEAGPALAGLAGVIYLPSLDREQGLALLAGAYRPLGVQSPQEWRLAPPSPSAAVR
ncbi:MAG: hypothetical protein JWN79_1447 [Gemmatimonadetes bacterium]|jgi:hypothetical protein|nr:hypothetical protein [Gemmatimonadota bacterium]